MYGGGTYGGGMGSQWLMSLNSTLFGIQSVVFSLGQAVQIVGMNAQQIRHVYDGIRGMLESALGHVNDKLGLVGVATIDEVMSAKLAVIERRVIRTSSPPGPSRMSSTVAAGRRGAGSRWGYKSWDVRAMPHYQAA